MRSLLAGIYGGVVKVKNAAFDQNLLDSYGLPVPVVSLGNLSVGGTGKTPVTLALAKELSKTYRRIAIVVRSYKTPLSEPRQVMLGAFGGPALFGDEAYFLAERAAAVVFSGPDKTETAKFAFEKVRPDLILVDDGFQHRKLHRDLDFVLWDATETHDKLLPAGRLREGFESLNRASGIFLTKVNWADPSKVEALRVRFKGLPVCEVSFDLNPKDKFWEDSFGRPVAALSAVARNDVFQTQLEKRLGRPLDQVFSFPDHHALDEKALAPVFEFLKKHPDALLAVTEKDAVKLADWIKTESRIRSIGLVLKFDDQLPRFIERINSLKDVARKQIVGPVPEWPF